MGNRTSDRQTPSMRFFVYLTVFVAFTAYTLSVVVSHGLLGFLTVAMREPWAMQMLIDLALALTAACVWLVGDARKRGVNPWPFVALSATCGSIGVLAYLTFTRRFLWGSSRAP